jgi:predicted metal-binding membrane protein
MNQVSPWKRFAWRHPEWWSLALSLIAWLLLLGPYKVKGEGFKLTLQHHHHVQELSATWAGEFLWWIVMVIAMMFPLIVDCTRVTADRSLWARRNQAIFVFMLGYLAPWVLAGIVIASGIFILHSQQWFRPAIAIPFGFGLAALWQLTARKRRLLRSCHRTMPIAPHGWRANLGCLRYGWTIGRSCFFSCGPLMVACSLAGHGLSAMAGTGSIAAAERYISRPNQRILSATIAGLGLICMFLLR